MKTRNEILAEMDLIEAQVKQLYTKREALKTELRAVNNVEVIAKHGINGDEQIKMTSPLAGYLRELRWSENDIQEWATKRQLYIKLEGELDSVMIAAHDLGGRPYGYLNGVPLEIALFSRRMWLADNA
jgi:hypothetical protein